ncbi:MAG: ribosomal protein S18-alanine N-acetyltransferase [Lachnospiraceae bacterium]|nr:ribosomal protein S18-alanine N-acetyltransferase [Lachnospiraceae bacterium]
MDSRIEIRRMSEGDIPDVAAIEASSFSLPWSENGFRTALGRRDTVFYVATVEGRIAGYAGFYICLDEADITNIAVTSDHRRKGIGARLMDEVISACSLKGVLMIALEVRAGNEPAKALYRKCGFQEVGLRKGFYSSPTEDACVMTRYLETEDNKC